MLMRTKLAPFAVAWLLLILTLALITSPSIAQHHEADERQPHNREWSNENAPAGIRLASFMSWYLVERQRGDPLINSMLSAGEFRAEDFDSLLAYFRDLQVEIWSELDHGGQRMACHDRASELNVVELRAVLNAYQEFQESTFAKYVAIASAELAPMGYVDFPEKLRRMANAFGFPRPDYLDPESVSENRLIDTRTKICNRVTSLDSATAQITSPNTQY